MSHLHISLLLLHTAKEEHGSERGRQTERCGQRRREREKERNRERAGVAVSVETRARGSLPKPYWFPASWNQLASHNICSQQSYCFWVSVHSPCFCKCLQIGKRNGQNLVFSFILQISSVSFIQFPPEQITLFPWRDFFRIMLLSRTSFATL